MICDFSIGSRCRLPLAEDVVTAAGLVAGVEVVWSSDSWVLARRPSRQLHLMWNTTVDEYLRDRNKTADSYESCMSDRLIGGRIITSQHDFKRTA